ncbi:pectin esterase [Prevotella sp. PCHR]|uniref:Pectinesterase n=1 Tax=Xylanibacter caecicola TaxID=2736294 RepID=A0ABX2B527_9BACT|nr:pectin esterase [Xylanibacter caecicola]
MKKFFTIIAALMCAVAMDAANPYDNPDTLVVSRDGTGEFRTIDDAVEVCRAFMDYHKVIYVKKGVYKEKLIIPSWLTNIEICGEDAENTIITYDDHANIRIPGTDRKMGTFRTYTVKVEGNDITFKNITIENNAARLGQAVALHTEGDRLVFINCRFLGNQDTIYTGVGGTRLYFKNCYIEGTTDFIFGPSTAWFDGCTIYSKINSYVTAASTPADIAYGYVFNNCRLTAAPAADKVHLGRPWRPYAHTLFMNCELGGHIVPRGWHNWGKTSNEQTARYMEYNNRGEGAGTAQRAPWSRQLTKKEAAKITIAEVFKSDSSWIPAE